eukprot:8065387-Lingulodinium_polyedra.AAC.1
MRQLSALPVFSVRPPPGRPVGFGPGFCSPDASGVGVDCCEAMQARERAHYGGYLEDVARNGLQYAPLVFSCYGR